MNNRLPSAIMTAMLLAGALLAGVPASAQFMPGFRYRYPQKTGEQIFQGVCQACHMPNANGAVGAGAYPALAGDQRLAAVSYPAAIVANGFAAMPPFRDNLSPQQIAAVVNYVRTHFGNHFRDRLTVAEVKTVLARTAGRQP
jgi:mono/diheme cytochrome c family protein